MQVYPFMKVLEIMYGISNVRRNIKFYIKENVIEYLTPLIFDTPTDYTLLPTYLQSQGKRRVGKKLDRVA